MQESEGEVLSPASLPGGPGLVSVQPTSTLSEVQMKVCGGVIVNKGHDNEVGTNPGSLLHAGVLLAVQLAKTTTPVEMPPLSQERGGESQEPLASQSLVGQDLNWTDPKPKSIRSTCLHNQPHTCPLLQFPSPILTLSILEPCGKGHRLEMHDNTCHQASIHACLSGLWVTC